MEAELLKCLRQNRRFCLCPHRYAHVVCNGTNADGYNVVYCTLTIDLLASRVFC